MVGTRRPLSIVAIILVISIAFVIPFSGCGGGGVTNGGGGTPTSGTIMGTVQSGIGVPIQGAVVTATVGGQPFATVSGPSGNYSLLNLPFGIATLNASAPLQGTFGPMAVLLDAAQSTVVQNIQLSTGPPPPPTFP